jgi:hypothetical protein
VEHQNAVVIILDMKSILLFLALTLCATAQSPVEKPSEPGEAAAAKKVDPKLHADAVKLVEVSGAKQRIRDNLKQMVSEGKKQMMEKCPRCTPEFGDEWEKRFLERININDFLDVYVRVYEKYFTDAELNELIALQKEKETSKTASPSPALKEKLTSVMPSVMGDSVGGCSQIGAKLGAEIAGEIEREHPEYIRPPAKEDKP